MKWSKNWQNDGKLGMLYMLAKLCLPIAALKGRLEHNALQIQYIYYIYLVCVYVCMYIYVCFYVCIYMCVCVCVYVCVCMCVYVYLCVCVRVWFIHYMLWVSYAIVPFYVHTWTHTHIYLDIYLYICVYKCVCVGGWMGVGGCVSVCVRFIHYIYSLIMPQFFS